MNHKQKLVYMALGALIMLIGMGVGSTFFTPPIEAQQDGFFNHITCRELKVVDKNGKEVILLDSREGGNRVEVLNKQGKPAVKLSTNREDGGQIDVYNNQRERRAVMGVNKYGNGVVGTWDKNGRSNVQNGRGGDSLSPAVVESKIDGDFEGWDGETIVKLMNGQIWQQTEFHYHYHYAFMPEVLIYKSRSGYKMLVEGVKKPVGVERLK